MVTHQYIVGRFCGSNMPFFYNLCIHPIILTPPKRMQLFFAFMMCLTIPSIIKIQWRGVRNRPEVRWLSDRTSESLSSPLVSWMVSKPLEKRVFFLLQIEKNIPKMILCSKGEKTTLKRTLSTFCLLDSSRNTTYIDVNTSLTLKNANVSSCFDPHIPSPTKMTRLQKKTAQDLQPSNHIL